LATYTEGTLTADGTEQDIINTTVEGAYEGYIDLTNMASGDEVRIRVYIQINSVGALRKVYDQNFIGGQDPPLCYIHRRTARYGYRVTLQQVAGTYRSFDYQITQTTP